LLITATDQNLDIIRERMKLVNLRNQIGSGSKVEVLMMQTDENKSNAELLKLKQQLLSAKAELNLLMNRPPETEFTAETDIPLNNAADVESWRNDLLSKNTSLLLAKQNEYAGEQLIKESRSLYLPQINLNTSFNFLRNQTEAGFVLLNRQTGLNGGLIASWTIFNGSRTASLVQERKLTLLKMRYFTEKSKQEIQSTLYVQYRQYKLAESLAALETENLKSAQELLNISEERFKTGKATLIETKETQKILEEAKVRLINARYELKLAETELMKAAGVLVK
jgi:outer membrane protein